MSKAAARKRKRASGAPTSMTTEESRENPFEEISGDEAYGDTRSIHFATPNDLFVALREAGKQAEPLEFDAAYDMALDPMITDKARVQMTAHEIWVTTGFRFR
ncbi:hypothetical protein HGRIS_004292 [Hohenbuehelia grisea]|uniref:Uncharacterized protein n=1 Tax=Hohenbuehelia grisea TaxID=104357 RepID=A0ABR3IPC8_9AGAR